MNKGDQKNVIQRDLAMLCLLLWSFSQALLLAYSTPDERLLYLIIILMMDIFVLLGYLRKPSVSAALCGTLTCVWVSYKLYVYYESGVVFSLLDFLLVPMPLIGTAAAYLFHNSLMGMNAENAMLRRQVTELVLVDEATGLYNLRALFRDLQIVVSYATRNKRPVTLMLIQMRYAEELKSMLPDRKFNELKKLLSNAIIDCVRMEDRLYCLTSSGMMALVLTTDEAGGESIKSRIRARVLSEGEFDEVLDRETRVEMQFALKQYDLKYGKDMIAYKKDTENELAYDV